jgi:hypothetical protein
MRADAFGPAAVTGLAGQVPRRSLHRGDATGAALASTEKTEIRRWRAGLRDKARRAFSPPVLGSRCGGSALKRTSHNGLLHARPAFRSPSSLPPGMRATPVMSCAPSRLQDRSSCGCAARTMVRRAARAVMVLAPARPPSAPQGGSLASLRHRGAARPPRLAMRCKPKSRLPPHSTSVLKCQRVKAKPPSRRGQSRGLDPITTCAGPRPRTANSRTAGGKEENTGGWRRQHRHGRCCCGL